MMTRIRSISILAIALLLQACAAPAHRLEEPGAVGSIGSTTTISIDDKRPSEDKEFSMGSLIVASSNYGIHTLGDTQFEPPVLDAFVVRLQRGFARAKLQPQKVKIRLDRLITQDNAQAYLLRTSSMQLGPLGIWIAETMAGHRFEMSIDETKPFVLGVLKGNAEVVWSDQKTSNVPLLITRAINYPNPFAMPERIQSRVATVNAVLDTAVDAIVQAKP
jgi:hypothetical protein